MIIYSAGFFSKDCNPNLGQWLKAIRQCDPSVETIAYGGSKGSIALCHDNVAEPLPFDTKTKKDKIHIYDRKIHIFVMQFVC